MTECGNKTEKNGNKGKDILTGMHLRRKVSDVQAVMLLMWIAYFLSCANIFIMVVIAITIYGVNRKGSLAD